MSATRIRYENIMALFDGYKKAHKLAERGSVTAFSKAICTSAKHFGQVKNTRTNIGNGFARQIERHLGLAEGWMDKEHLETDPQTADEEEFIDTALALFRLSPESAQAAMLRSVHDMINTLK